MKWIRMVAGLLCLAVFGVGLYAAQRMAEKDGGDRKDSVMGENGIAVLTKFVYNNIRITLEEAG